MKKLLITMSLLLMVVLGYSQVTNVGEFRITDANTAFGTNLPVGTKVYDIANNKYYVATAGVASTATLTTANASFSLINDAGSDNQSATEVGVTANGNLAAENVQAALEELQSDIDLIDTNVETDLSLGTVTETTMDINSSDGTNATLTAATSSEAGVMTSNQVSKLNSIEYGAQVNLIFKTEEFEIENDGESTCELSSGIASGQTTIVTINGVRLAPDKFTVNSQDVTISVPVYKYDKVIISYYAGGAMI